MDGNAAAEGGERRRMAAKAVLVAGVGILATAAMNLPPSAVLRRLSPPDIHSEYVKFLSGKDTVTAYIAYPERPQPAPAVIVIHEILACRISSGRRPNSWRRMVSSPSRPTCCHVGAARPRHPTPRASLSQH